MKYYNMGRDFHDHIEDGHSTNGCMDEHNIIGHNSGSDQDNRSINARRHRHGCRMAAFAMVVGLSIGLCACQPNPDSEAVIGKDAQQLESLISNTAAASDSSDEDKTKIGSGSKKTDDAAGVNGDNSVNVSTDGSGENTEKNLITGDLTIDNNKIHVAIKAEMKTLTGSKPVIRVKPRTITSDDVRKWAEFFYEGHRVFNALGEMTKDEIAKQIQQWRELLEGDELREQYKNAPDDLAREEQYYREAIEDYEKKYLTAPDDSKRAETDYTFAERDEDERGMRSIELTSDYDNHTSKISASIKSDEDYVVNSLMFIDGTPASARGKSSKTKEEAIELVENAIRSLGLKDWQVASCDLWNRDGSWVINCQKYYEGVPVTVLPALQLYSGDNEYAAKYMYEDLMFQVHDGKIVVAKLNGTLEEVEVENDNVGTLTSDEMMNRFKDHIALMFTSNSGKQDIKISKIEEGLVRIKIPNCDNEFRLVPAWCFYGNAGDGFGSESGDGEFVYTPLICINEIDGSIIDTTKGY